MTHPSLPNYLAMIAGDEFGIRDNDPSCFASDLRPLQSCHRFGGDSLVDQLEAAGLTWALYAESLPAAGALQQVSSSNGPTALYAQKHNPFVYFGKAPNFAFIVPNQCHDGHGLPMCRDPDHLTRDYDAFVEQPVGMIRASPNWTRNSAIVVTFDGAVTLSIEERENSAARIFSSDRDCGAPRVHRRSANDSWALAEMRWRWTLNMLYAAA